MRKLLSVLFPLPTSPSSIEQNDSTPKKFALVIGNGAYTNSGKLKNPINDADDMADVLFELGFTVDKVLNGDLIQMEEAITRYKNQLSETQNTYGFFYYAGHGVQHKGTNYLIPVDIDIPSGNYLGERSISVQTLLEELTDAGNELNIIVLDACRDDPFFLNRGCSRGLAKINTIPGSIIMYATSSDERAEDGTGRNGLFTSQLLLNLRLQGLCVRDLFDRTGDDVIRASQGRQYPQVSSSYFRPVYLGVMPMNDSEQTTQVNHNVHAQIHFDRGKEYDSYGEEDSAIAEFTEAIRLNPNYAAAYNNRGLLYGIKSNFDQAIADFDQAIKLNPILAEAYNNRGNAYNNIGDYSKAIADLTQAILLKPNDEEGYINRGDTYYRKGDYGRAILDLDYAIQLNPRSSGAYNNRGNAYRGKGGYDQAISDFEKAMRLNPNLPEAYNNRGNAYRDKGNYDQAIIDYSRGILMKNPFLPDLYYNRGMTYANIGDNDRAISDYDVVIQLNPNDARAYNNRGYSYYTKGDYDKAIVDYETALRIDPNYILARNNLEQALQAQGGR